MKDKMRNKDVLGLNRNLFKCCSRTYPSDCHSLTVPTRQRAASPEFQVLHAHWKMQLREVTCEKDSTPRHEKGRRRGRRK